MNKQHTTPTRLAHKICVAGAVALSVFVVGCASTPPPRTPDFANNRDADRLVVTDCLLPGQVRQLGARRSYLTPRRPIKTTVSDCEIRGGEYVAYDRANYATALKIWLPRAQEGDAEAQTYVGEIYEKGLGIQADYGIASQWYQKAADQGNSRAAINLGYLYEAGLGVEQDLSQAMNWYRTASGLTDGTVEYVSSLEKVKREQAVVDQKLLTEEVARLKTELAEQKALLTQSRNGYKQKQLDIESLKSQLTKRNESVAVQALERAQALSAADNSDEINALRQREIDLGRQLKTAQAEQLRLSESLANSSLSQFELDEKLNATNQQLASAKTALTEQQKKYAEAEQLLAKQSTTEEAQGNLVLTLATTRAELLRQRNRVAELEISLTSNEKSRADNMAARAVSLESIQTQLGQQQAEVARLTDKLSTEQLSSQEQINQLLASNDRDKNTITSLKSQLDGGQKEQARLAEELMSVQLAALSASDDETNNLKAQLTDNEEQLRAQQTRITTLEQQVTERQAGLSSQQNNEAIVAANTTGPSIEIIEPPLTLTRSSPSILLRSNVPSVQVIGKVDSEQPLLTFTINGAKQNLDENGIFTADWKVESIEDQVSMVAVDKLGNRTALDFNMIAASASKVDNQPPKQKKQNAIGDINFGSYYALVIGNNRYQYMTNLKSAVTDAKAVAEVLEQQYGFETTLLVDATRYEILSALNTLRETLTEEDNLLIYYAGHGELDKANQRGYWLPVDSETDSSTNWISNVAITDILNVMNVRHVLAVVDSCYSLALTRSAVARLDTGWTSEQHKDWYKTMLKTRARTVLTSGGLKPVLDGGGGQHSVFAEAFLDSLRKNDSILDGYSLYREVQKRMKVATNKLNVEQDPQYAPIKFAGHEAGEFFLLPDAMRRAKNNAPTRAPAAPLLFAAID